MGDRQAKPALTGQAERKSPKRKTHRGQKTCVDLKSGNEHVTKVATETKNEREKRPEFSANKSGLLDKGECKYEVLGDPKIAAALRQQRRFQNFTLSHHQTYEQMRQLPKHTSRISTYPKALERLQE